MYIYLLSNNLLSFLEIFFFIYYLGFLGITINFCFQYQKFKLQNINNYYYLNQSN